MGTEVLRPHDIFARKIRASPAAFHHRRKNPFAKSNGSSYGYQKPAVARTEPKKKLNNQHQHPESKNSRKLSSADDLKATRHSNKTTMMRSSAADDRGDLVASAAEKLGAEPADVYAGSAFSVSPSPRSLPLPTFFQKSFDDSATRGLRRLLRLE